MNTSTLCFISFIFLFINQSEGDSTECREAQFLDLDETCRDCHPYCMTCTSFGTSVAENDCLCLDFIHINSTHFHCVENCDNYKQNTEIGEICQTWLEFSPDIRYEHLTGEQWQGVGALVGSAGAAITGGALMCCSGGQR